MASKGGTQVKTGFYWSPKAWEMAMIPAGGGTLPGSANHEFFRVPTLLFLVLAPIMGAGYVFFLPFVGFVLVANWAARRAGVMAKDAFMLVASAISPKWAPGEAYLAGRRRERKAMKAAREAADMKRLENEAGDNS
jgi:hypothetical protein